jgi:hypothetical protein
LSNSELAKGGCVWSIQSVVDAYLQRFSDFARCVRFHFRFQAAQQVLIMLHTMSQKLQLLLFSHPLDIFIGTLVVVVVALPTRWLYPVALDFSLSARFTGSS